MSNSNEAEVSAIPTKESFETWSSDEDSETETSDKKNVAAEGNGGVPPSEPEKADSDPDSTDDDEDLKPDYVVTIHSHKASETFSSSDDSDLDSEMFSSSEGSDFELEREGAEKNDLRRLFYKVVTCTKKTFSLEKYRISRTAIEVVFPFLMNHPYIQEITLSSGMERTLLPADSLRLTEILATNQVLGLVNIEEEIYRNTPKLAHAVLMGSAKAKVHFAVNRELLLQQKNVYTKTKLTENGVRIEKENDKMIKLLREHADIDREGREARQAKLREAYEARPAKKEIPLDTKPALNKALHSLCQKGASYQAVVALLKKGADPNALNLKGFSCLSIVANKGYLDIARALIAYGAEVNKGLRAQYDLQGPTHNALVSAIFSTNYLQAYEMIKLLLNCGADPNSLSPHVTALGTALRNQSFNVVKLLVMAGADLLKKDFMEKTLLECADMFLMRSSTDNCDKYNREGLEAIVDYLKPLTEKALQEQAAKQAKVVTEEKPQLTNDVRNESSSSSPNRPGPKVTISLSSTTVPLSDLIGSHETKKPAPREIEIGKPTQAKNTLKLGKIKPQSKKSGGLFSWFKSKKKNNTSPKKDLDVIADSQTELFTHSTAKVALSPPGGM